MRIQFILIITWIIAADTSPIFNLPPILMDDTPVTIKSNTHTTIFNPVGKYATDVQYMLIRLPIHLAPLKEAQEEIGTFMHNVVNIVRGKATAIPIKQIVAIANSTLKDIKARTLNMQLNLPTSAFSPHGGEKKRFLDLIFGIAATAFGISNGIQVAKLNAT